jgi:enamine deaminase RidA (YjgF/YER057c/UK114 family)
MMHQLLPPGWKRPSGYSAGIVAEGRTVFVAGLVGWNEREELETDDFADQLRQTLVNIRAVLAEAGAEPRHIVRMTWYVTDKDEYLGARAEVGEAWREVFGRVYPAMAVVEVKGLIEDRAKLEIETTAVVPTP